MNYDNLQKLELPELRTLAIQQGMTPHHRAKKDTLIRQIIEHVTQPPVKKDMKHPAEQPPKEAKLNTEADVSEAIKPFMKEGYQAIFTEENWHFKYKGAEDCGHMSVPLRVIRMKAESVSRGARNPKMVKIDGEMVLDARR